MNNQLVHLHLHTEYSLLDAMNRLKDLAKRAKAMGFEAMAITDHGNMFGVADFSKQMQKAGIKPIIGCEMYIIPSGIKDKRRDNRHVVLLAKNEIGYHNLCMLASIASLDGYYYDARIDHETLEKYSEGLIVLSACLGGDVAKEIKAGLRLEEGQEASDLTSWDAGYERGRSRAMWYKSIFKDDFYLEIQDNGIKEQYLLNDQLIKMSKETGIELVYAGDTHYLDRELAVHHDVYMALGSGTTVDNPKRKRYSSDEFYLKSYEQVMSTGLIPIEAVENTVKIANKVTYMMEFGKYKIPEFKRTPKEQTAGQYLREIGMKGLKERYPDTWDQNLARFDYELSVIDKMGFNDYFLIVWDFVMYAKRKHYFPSPGRGSVGGSILAYALRITHIDPIKHGLLFVRFLNEFRISMPDIDWDISNKDRQDMIRYVEEEYGKDCVSQIITFNRARAKNTPREVCRALNLPYELGDKIAKSIPDIVGITIEDALEMSPELKEYYDTDPVARNVIDISISFQSLPSFPSTHAAGVVIAPFPLAGKLPLWKTRPKGKNSEKINAAIVVQSEMGILEEQGFLKMDFLGLAALDVIVNTIRAVKRNYNVDIDYEELIGGLWDAPETYKVIRDGDTESIFQVEGHGITGVAKAMGIASFEELTALLALYRPGPMDFIPDYIRNKNNPGQIKIEFPELESILKETYGVLTYQEQVIQMLQDLAGYTMAEADGVRKAISKKNDEAMAANRITFCEKGSAKYSVSRLERYWDSTIAPFTKYAFNKSHAVGYAVISAMHAWLKAHYPVEFMASALENGFDKGMTPERKDAVMLRYFSYLKQKNIAVVSPDVQTGDTAFFATKDGKILYGLSSIKGVGGAAEAIVENREKYGPFEDFSEFVNRVGNLSAVNRSAIEAIILAGGCDSFGVKRSEALVGMEAMLTRLKARKTCKSESTRETKYPFLGMKVMPTLDEFPILTILTKEKMLCKTYLSGHPLDEYKRMLNSTNTITLDEAISGTEEDFKLRAGDNYRGIVMMESMKEVYTKAEKKPMAICSIADLTGSISMPIFNKDYLFLKSIIKVGDILMVEGKLGEREGQPSILFSSVNHFSTQEIKDKVYIKADTVSLDEAKRVILACGRGEHPVILVVYNFSMPLPKKFWVNEDGIEILKKRFSVQLMH